MHHNLLVERLESRGHSRPRRRQNQRLARGEAWRLRQCVTGFRLFKLGYASAMACALTVLILAVSLIQMRFPGRNAGFGQQGYT
jgi:hypothetical protein